MHKLVMTGSFLLGLSWVAGSEASLSEGQVFETSYKEKDQMVIPVSAVYFQESKTASGASGFTAASLLELSGKIRKTIRDHRRLDSPQLIFEQFLNDAKQRNHTVLFQCHAEVCGDKDGFRAFFSTRLNDDGKHQHYAVTRSPSGHHVLYIVNIDNTPRSLLVNIEDHLIREKNKNIISFAPGSSDLSNAAKNTLQIWYKTIPLIKRDYAISVAGYTDESGGSERNMALAEARAVSVRDFLIEKLAVPEKRVLIHAAGELARPKSAELGRYVELNLIQ